MSRLRSAASISSLDAVGIGGVAEFVMIPRAHRRQFDLSSDPILKKNLPVPPSCFFCSPFVQQ